MRTAPLALALLVLAVPPVGAEVTVFDRIDKNHSTVGFRVPILGGLSEVEGKFTEFSVRLAYDHEEVTRSAVEATIQVASIDTGIEMRDDDLRSGNFFAAAEHPEIRFRSTAIERRGTSLVALGELTLRGVTRAVELEFEVSGLHEEPDSGKLVLGVRASTRLDRDDYGIDWRHPDPLFVGDQVSVDIRLISRLTARGAAPAAP